MFTGLVEAVGNVRLLEISDERARLVVELPFSGALAMGDSVAVNGCCLTVAALEDGAAAFDLLGQTLAVTSLGGLAAGSAVNLERAMAANARLGGHIVQGHVDGTGKILSREERGQDHIVTIGLPPEIRAVCVEKGSLAVDGISLTIAELGENAAVFWITPHTWAHTNLSSARPGESVNLEADVLAKMIDALLDRKLAARNL